MKLRFYVDPDTGEPHIFRHNVSEIDVEDVLAAPVEDISGYNGARVAVGRARGGRWLRVVYVEEGGDGSVLVITAYTPGNKVLRALRRRKRRHR
ncbi:MAG: hypothetical protein HY875_11470 [Chloroflexi bacterium]|nr:hypothetical protein [Chloroflexota bacterium]